MPPLVSICLPNLNTRPFLEERMETILAQTMPDWELIVCDSYSNDGSWEFFQKFRSDPRVRLYQVPREGLYAGWNECLRRVQGDYVYIATSDDTAVSHLLERLLQPLECRDDLHLAVCDFQEIDHAGRILSVDRGFKRAIFGDWLQTPSIRDGKTEFLLHSVFGTLWGTLTSVLFRRKLLSATGLFRTDLGPCADEEWVLRASLASDIAFMPEKLATWRVHPAQATGRLPVVKREHYLITSLESVLKDKDAGLPEEWRRIPDWKETLLEAHLMSFRNSLGLYRWEIKRSLPTFVRNALLALRADPEWLVHQTGNGFRWSEDHLVDGIAQAHKLIRMFNASWPPVPVGPDWRPLEMSHA